MSSHLMETPLITASELIQSSIEILQKQGQTDKTALDSLRLAQKVLQGLDPYLDASSTEGPKGLKALIEETDKHDYDTAYKNKQLSFPVSAKWSAGAYEGNFIAMIAKAIKAKRVLEVGMFTGTTTLAVADVLPKEGGKIIALELDAYLRELANPFFERAGVKERVDVRIGKAMDSIQEMIKAKEDPFDLIFIDADKGAYQQYYDVIMDNGLLRKGGVLLVDNVLYKASPFVPELQQATPEQLKTAIQFENGKALAAFNKFVRQDDRVDVTILPVRDGVSWIQYKG
ncbi:S-adenosyl-L-methionine-dependent methyltransferase [Meira miltonrushii]|uniref:S-adenosyl-L-methionine-dependent methyltransferase n=1 Tax=Meira miltonrushii TaxID=1280837 RepID=A0A316VAI3_9BASI|nr:S-adenosyl-L-methionine-dependent methyltransferase [Meira miltonrushii]PWN34526.1 S-adenosyl-L-methionine-dependent methyltransferase [Meira miltonrushii]